jgi:hypothetical protein
MYEVQLKIHKRFNSSELMIALDAPVSCNTIVMVTTFCCQIESISSNFGII